MMGSYDGKVALVTGATRGIGRVTAVAFAREGARVVVCGRNEEGGEETVRLAREAGGEAIFLRADVRVESDVEELMARAVSAYGRLDCAFNNAGAETTHPLVKMGNQDYDVTMDTNVRGVFLCMKHEIPRMIEAGGGAIVNESSAGGLVAVPEHSLYCASKAAVIMLTKNTALEVAGSGVRVNAVCPATIDGQMLRGYMAAKGLTEDQVRGGMPIGRIGKPEDVAEAVLFLCSEKTSYITGATLAVDGGFSLQGG